LILDAHNKTKQSKAPFDIDMGASQSSDFNIDGVTLLPRIGVGKPIPASQVYFALVKDLLSNACSRMGGEGIYLLINSLKSLSFSRGLSGIFCANQQPK
jgi:hypothetical protein